MARIALSSGIDRVHPLYPEDNESMILSSLGPGSACMMFFEAELFIESLAIWLSAKEVY